MPYIQHAVREHYGAIASNCVINLSGDKDARAFLTEAGLDVDALARQVDGRVASAFIRGRKPAAAAQHGCCAPTCCAQEP